MMRLKDRFYCVSCGEMVASPDADILFRTGFFQVVHPMGYCLTCSIQHDKEDSISGSSGKTNNYHYKMFLRAEAKAAEQAMQSY
ncbi:hypothetical protein [Paenibacillus harenae]|uniref:hypothetical protein n=1 Tax=Paenibacillus harenae TaxID=306543 RepID=UPI0012EB0CE6|nr:hypothetical protein [Paenibacillus harenae]